MTQSTDEKREGADREEYLASYDISAYDRPSVTADAVISDPAGRILLVKRKNPPYKGCWALPGGWVDVNQSVGDNAVKEALEESGLDVMPERNNGGGRRARGSGGNRGSGGKCAPCGSIQRARAGPAGVDNFRGLRPAY